MLDFFTHMAIVLWLAKLIQANHDSREKNLMIVTEISRLLNFPLQQRL
jgi:hypothetical protein